MTSQAPPERGKEETPQAVPFWRDPGKRAILFQAIALLIVFGIGFILFSNTQANLERQNIAVGFSFLEKEASFEIGESLIDYSATDRYSKAILVGLLNTLKVSVIGIVLTLILGTVIGIARLSHNWLVSKLAGGFIEVMQNIPVLLQLFFWYAVFINIFPHPREYTERASGEMIEPLINGLYFTSRGILHPIPAPHSIHSWMLVAFAVAVAAWFFLNRWGHKRQDLTGRAFPVHRSGLALCLILPGLVWAIGGAPTAMDMPVWTRFNFQGGSTLSPEFCALLLGLVLYTSAFVAEIVRAGIQSVYKGQVEAAMAIGLKPGQVLRLVILPQALRVIIPPTTSQMLNLTKNSSLAVAIGYPEIVQVASTTINQTGQAIEGVAIIMVVYLSLSLATSAFMNWYNKKMALVER